MRGGSLGYPVGAVVFLLVCSLVLTACASVQQPEATAPSADSPQPEATAPSADSSQPEVATPAGRSVLDGVFTVRQVSRGTTTFRQVCVACHSINDFRGARFRLVWAGRTVGDLFFIMSAIMPQGDPGSLSPEEYANIVSYMLSENGYPAGEVDLPADQPTLAGILIEAAGT
jgi:mono/diheme cytochrome c family protein